MSDGSVSRCRNLHQLKHMISIKIAVSFLLAFILVHECRAQSGVDSLRINNINTRIAIKTLLGDWYSADSAKSKIEFVAEGNYYVVMKPLMHAVNYYMFNIERDSAVVNGTAPNWRPYDCMLHLINDNTLEIKFSQFFYKETYVLIYKRK
ncbi:hypothetical protein EMGBS15_13480 [Filimonas sp.]|jgi:hypothetical protein|nr:hypothetical protein EMGBS15_13480 [Filimonas sp.]